MRNKLNEKRNEIWKMENRAMIESMTSLPTSLEMKKLEYRELASDRASRVL